MLYKTHRGAFKLSSEPGEFTAVFATLNVVDRDNDVTLPGAFEPGAEVRISHWNHDWNQLPVGRGAIHERGAEVVVDGRFFLGTEHGKQHYETVKGLGDLQEWSYGYRVIDSAPGQFQGKEVRYLKRLQVFEVSPVMLGAGVGTRTEFLKAAGGNDAVLRGQLYAMLAGEQIDRELTTLLKQQVTDFEGELLKEGSPAMVSVAIGAMGGRKGATTRADAYVKGLIRAAGDDGMSEEYALTCLQMQADSIAKQISLRAPHLTQDECQRAALRWLSQSA